VRAIRRSLVASGALGIVVASALPAAAAVPSPRPEEWWFPPWSVEQRIWPATQGQGVTVAVLDSGVNAKLPEIAGALVPGGDVSGHGTDGRTDFDEHGHGTSMSVLIAGQGGGRTRLVGIAPQAKIMPVAVAAGDVTPEQVTMPLAKGIRFAVDHGAQVVNMSVGATAAAQCPPAVMSAIAYAVAHDVVLVASAGNTGDTDNAVDFPAMCPGVLAVGATDRNSAPWRSTQAHDYVSVAAPGVDMPTTGKNENFYYPHSDGSSNAAALVSGAAALVRSANPSMPAREVVHRLIGTALDVSTPGRDDRTGYGIVRIPRAMDTAYPVSADAPNPPYQRFDQWQHPGAGTSATSAPAASHHKSRTGLIALVVVVIAVALAGLAWLVRRGGRPGPPPGASVPPPGTTSGPAPRREPGEGADGFWGNGRPTFEPPAEDRSAGG
jgi:type VII secretion-associated serine protease mycosin